MPPRASKQASEGVDCRFGRLICLGFICFTTHAPTQQRRSFEATLLGIQCDIPTPTRARLWRARIDKERLDDSLWINRSCLLRLGRHSRSLTASHPSIGSTCASCWRVVHVCTCLFVAVCGARVIVIVVGVVLQGAYIEMPIPLLGKLALLSIGKKVSVYLVARVRSASSSS